MDILMTYEKATGLNIGKKLVGFILVPEDDEEEGLLYTLLQSHDVIGPSEIIEVGEYKNEYFDAQTVK